MSITKPTAIQRAALPSLLASSSASSNQRDAFIQSQTGSGKTLSFLLPIVQDLLPLSSLSYIDRSIGTLAIIIAPTRELAKQISDVLEKLLQLRLHSQTETTEDENGASNTHLTRWLVSGLLTGGATRTHEKARIRKGLPIIVSTPGRLLDHLQNTTSFNVGKCRWLVLDEADRLMELGFEESIQGIIKGLDGRRKLAIQAVEEGVSKEVGGWDWDRRRRTVLCSATIREDVQNLAGTALVNPMMIKAIDFDKPTDVPATSNTATDNNESAASSVKFTPPSQLSQKFVVVPLKLRLVALVALLRSLLANGPINRGTKIIVFMSCTDSVDYHWQLLGGASMARDSEDKSESSDHGDTSEGDDTERSPDALAGNRIAVHSPLLPGASLYRLHGSLATPTRLASLRAFSALPSTKSSERSKEKSSVLASILFCTSVASRGLDLPLVRAVVQYDLPTEGGETEYVHRVGRTARVGKGGEAWSFVAPTEVPWVKWVEAKMKDDSSQPSHDGQSNQKILVQPVSIETVLHDGFGGKRNEYEQRSTEVQLSFERWVLRRREVSIDVKC
jgi:ATP-dependent RNA helicase DDX31/DBP7